MFSRQSEALWFMVGGMSLSALSMVTDQINQGLICKEWKDSAMAL
ncbi:MAG: hypothetical protein V7K57_18020 [Nostoc sp.]